MLRFSLVTIGVGMKSAILRLKKIYASSIEVFGKNTEGNGYLKKIDSKVAERKAC